VVESTALEMRRTRKGTVGSNPTLSATFLFLTVPEQPGVVAFSSQNRRVSVPHYPLPFLTTPLMMWETVWESNRGKTYSDGGKGGSNGWTLWRWRRPVSYRWRKRLAVVDGSGSEERQAAGHRAR
jgi:hypothetical protein